MQVDFDKVSDYLKENIHKYLYCVNGEAGFPTAQFIDDMRNYFVGEKSSKEEQSHDTQIYSAGKIPMFNSGDELAITYFGEDGYKLGKIESVTFDDDFNDWEYTFENGNTEFEELLIAYKAHKIN